MADWAQMLASFTDELEKIAAEANVVAESSSSNVVAAPASVTKGPKVKTKLDPKVKPTNYSMVHSQQPEAAYGSSAGAKSVPPPPVRT